MKILKLPKSRNKTLRIKEKCDHCKTKVLINDLIDVIPGSIAMNDYGCTTDYQNFQYICPNCGYTNDVTHRIKLSKYLKNKSFDLYDQVRNLGEMMVSWKTKYDRSTRDLYKIMCLVADTGTHIDPELERSLKYKSIHQDMLDGKLPYEYDGKNNIQLHDIKDSIISIERDATDYSTGTKYIIKWSNGGRTFVLCDTYDNTVVRQWYEKV